jgi:DDE superfamily endonuclease
MVAQLLIILTCVHLTIKFPTTTDELVKHSNGFLSISPNAAIDNFVGVVDSNHLEIITPPKKNVKNVGSFYSGHYKTYGVNIQACCDHQCRFTFLGVAGPGVTGDREALFQLPIGKLIESLPHLYCVIGDCVYTPSEHLVPIYRGKNDKVKRNNNFNYYASQLRIRIEMAFGLMVKKWAILQRSLNLKMSNIYRLIVSIAQLHNFWIDKDY